jgi:hypothetical protein
MVCYPPVMPPEKISDASKQKWQDIFADYDRTVKTYSTMGALHSLAEYWVENEVIIERAAVEEVEKNRPTWTPDYNDEDSIGEFRAEQDTAREMHDKTLIPTHRYSCIVMLYSNVERELLRLIENLEKERGKQKLKLKDLYAASTVERISKFCEVFYGLRLVDCTNFKALNDLRKIRDCIVHGVGEVALLKSEEDRKYLVNLKDKRRDFFAHAGNEIYVGEECIKQFLMEVWSFFVSVFDALGWKIAAHWQGDKLEQTFKKLKK